MIYVLIYFFIGIIITELTAKNDQEYKEYVYSDYFTYLIEVITWFPDLFNFFGKDDDNENLGY